MPDDHSEVVPLLPIPNRTVKRLCADDSAGSRVKVGHRQALTAANAQQKCWAFCFVREQLLPEKIGPVVLLMGPILFALQRGLQEPGDENTSSQFARPASFAGKRVQVLASCCFSLSTAPTRAASLPCHFAKRVAIRLSDRWLRS